MTADLDISAEPQALATRVGEWLIERIANTPGRFSLNLSGGSTPKALYSVLASEYVRVKIDWEKVHLFFGDERFVPRDHKDSNYRMVDEALIARVPIPRENVHPVLTENGTPDEVASAYERELKAFYGKTTLDMWRSLFSVTLLGLGDDGHTASLFPGSMALLERDKWVTAVIGAKPEPRITMTYPVLASSDAVAFLVAGAGKHAMLTRMLKDDPDLPASQVKCANTMIVFCDEAAAGDLAARPA